MPLFFPPSAARSLKNFYYASPLYRLTFRDAAPESLKPLAPVLRPGDPSLGSSIMEGVFLLGNKPVPLEDNPWLNLPPSTEAAAQLNGFSWLADLIALGTDGAQKRARALTRQWIEAFGRWHELAWRPDVIGRRLAAWLSAYAYLTEDDDELRLALLGSMMVQARHLGRSCAGAPSGERAFAAVRGLLFAAVCLPGAEGFMDAALKLLKREIESQILPDGGHRDRNPSVELSLLDDLCDMRDLLRTARAQIPDDLQGAIDRMVPMLRALRHGDGGLALFNGGFEETRAGIDAVLARAGVRGKALSSAPHSGFQRLGAGRTVVIADAGTLSFEMSSGKHRLVVNCGGAAGDGETWRKAMDATAAHSTLAVDDKNSHIASITGQCGPARHPVQFIRRELDGSLWLEASHKGYAQGLGLTHRRKLFLDVSGEDFRGEDTLEGSGGSFFALRFHLHPNVHASKVRGRPAILLKLPGGVGWEFMASGGRIGLDESIYLGHGGAPRRTEQIVVSGLLQGEGARLKWRFGRIKG